MNRSLLLPLLMVNVLLQAAPVERSLARQRAEQFLGREVSDVNSHAAHRLPRHRLMASEAYYVFNAIDGEGFAIISADDALGDVLAYSMTHNFPVSTSLPCALEAYLDAFAEAVGSGAEAAGIDNEPVGSKADGSVTSATGGPLCATEWGQDAPYNTLCPRKDGQLCPSGCVATALAQLLYYWRWPVKGKGYSWAKDGNGETYSGTLEHAYSWSAMLNTTAENLASDEAAQAVAQLVYDCGLSVNMNYDTDGSGALTPIKALCNNFGYKPDRMRIYHAECFTDAEWFNLLRSEIDGGRPIYYTAASLTNGGKDAAGHAFIVDGYDAQGKVHVNWGWDGAFNGYFDLAKMNPGGYQFTLNQAALVGVCPARNGETGTPQEYLLVRSPLTCNQSGTIQNSVTFAIGVSSVWNMNGSSHTWQLSLGLFDVTNTMVAEVKTGRVPSLSLEPGYGYVGEFATINCSLKGAYPDGDYAIRLVFRESGSREWLLPDMAGGLRRNAVYVNIKGTRISFTDGSKYIATGLSGTPFSSLALTNDSLDLTRVFDASGRQVYSAPTSSFNLWDIPARGVLVVKQDNRVRKVVR